VRSGKKIRRKNSEEKNIIKKGGSEVTLIAREKLCWRTEKNIRADTRGWGDKFKKPEKKNRRRIEEGKILQMTFRDKKTPVAGEINLKSAKKRTSGIKKKDMYTLGPTWWLADKIIKIVPEDPP
jgi:hypothetical protein